ncbi:MAG: MoxR family ATPase [Pseudomonadota bacterium]
MLNLDGIEARVAQAHPKVQAIRDELQKALIGQRAMVDGLLMGLLCDGHVLLEGVPGLAKTTAVRALAGVLELGFSRIQFTPDLLPADLIGTEVYHLHESTFSIRKGPVFTNILLADEINRAPAKVQSALLEAMQERQVTIGEQSFPLPRPFLVLATQNPIEQEGTYPLPEAQVDRFLLKLKVGYPSREEELRVMRLASDAVGTLQPVLGAADVLALREVVAAVHMEAVIEGYIVDVVRASRNPAAVGLAELVPMIEFGASPRASMALSACARAHAFLEGRAWVGPDDVKAVGPDVLRHRVLLSFEAEASELTPEAVIRRLFDHVPTP